MAGATSCISSHALCKLTSRPPPARAKAELWPRADALTLVTGHGGLLMNTSYALTVCKPERKTGRVVTAKTLREMPPLGE